MNAEFAFAWQNAFESVKPAFVTSLASQLKKQFLPPVDSKGAQTWGKPSGHSPITAQQSRSCVHSWLQYPFGTRVMHTGSPLRVAGSIPG